MSTDSVDAVDYEWDPSKQTTTGWSTRAATKSRRTYSRRGSTGDAAFTRRPLFGRSHTVPTASSLSSSSHNVAGSGGVIEGGDNDSLSSFGDSTFGIGQWNDTSSARDSLRDAWQDSLSSSRARPPRARRFTRANSISLANVSHTPEPSTIRRSYSVSSSRSDSIRSSTSTTDISENFDPNFDPLEMNASPKRSAAMDGDGRGRKKVRSGRNQKQPLATLSASNSSFSHLAKHGEGGLSWAAKPPSDSSPSIFSGVDFGGYQTDATSSPATASVGSSRKRGVCGSPSDDTDYFGTAGFSGGGVGAHSRSRSRIFSPPTSRFSSLDMSSCCSDKINRTMDISSDDGVETDDLESSEGGDDSGDDASVESEGNDRPAIPSFAARPSTQKKYSRMSGFTESLFESGDKKERDDPNKQDEVILGTMSSHKDLRYLIRELRKECSGNNRSMHVAPPSVWEKTRRASFFRWSESLGFTMRSGGMGISYLQISKHKGAEVLVLLQSAYETYKEQSKQGSALSSDVGVTPSGRKSEMMDLTSSTKKKSATDSGFNIDSTFNSFPNSIHKIVETSDDIDMELILGMGSLGVNEKSQATSTVESRIVFEEDDDSCGVETSRPSMENHASARDLMCHLHGMSPAPCKAAPTRLSLHSITSSGAACKHVANSPFPSAAISSTGLSSHKKSLSFDFVETPMMKQPEQGWGSCPVGGRDWGTSECCHDSTMKELMQRFRQAREDAGFCDSTLEPRSADLGFDLEAASCYREQADSPTSVSNSDCAEDMGLYDAAVAESPATMRDRASSLARLEKVVDNYQIDENIDESRFRLMRRRMTSVAKHKRMSLIASVMNPIGPNLPKRKSMFTRPSKTGFMPSEQFIQETMSSNAITKEIDASNRSVNASLEEPCPVQTVFESMPTMELVFSYLKEHELLLSVSLVSSTWSDVATHAHANLMLMSVGCAQNSSESDYDSDEDDSKLLVSQRNIPGLLERSWAYLTETFPWACFLSEGAFKRVYKVYNGRLQQEEALSVMDVDMISSNGNINVVGTELAVTVMLSSMVRRGVCPNFVATRGVFSCPFEPPPAYWGSANNKCPKGTRYSASKSTRRKPREPKRKGLYQYIRMELCDGGDVEEFLKGQPDQSILPCEARRILFQIAFALHASADRFSMKHYDVKLLNVFLRKCSSDRQAGNVILRYGLGAHTFALRAPRERAILAKLADYGTANVKAESSGQPVTIAQFTTLENTPPEFLFLGDRATQGHGHDCFGLGLCMLHLFTGHAPYEEIMEDVVCPMNLKRKLRRLWEDENIMEFSVVRSVILQDVFLDEDGNVVEGEPDETLYDTFYRYLVLFGIPESPPHPQGAKVFHAVKEALLGSTATGKRAKKKESSDVFRYSRDRKKYSLMEGNNKYIARARQSLEAMEGGLDLIFSLVSFNHHQRYSALDVLNSTFMAPLKETAEFAAQYKPDDTVYSYTAFSTQVAS